MLQNQTFRIFLQLLHRDFYAFSKRFKDYGINFFIIYPIMVITTFGYLQPGIYLGPNANKGSIVLIVGTLSFNIILLCYNFISPLLYDLEADRFIEYQILLIAPRYLLLEMILFPALLANVLSLPFFGFAALIVPHHFKALNTHWIGLMLVLFCASLCAASYIMLAMCIIKKAYGVRKFWLRVNWPLVVLGGLWVPWYLLKQYSPTLGLIALADPILYITEGMRSALIGSDQFIPFHLCIFALLIFFCIFTGIASYFFKQKLDHI